MMLATSSTGSILVSNFIKHRLTWQAFYPTLWAKGQVFLGPYRADSREVQRNRRLRAEEHDTSLGHAVPG